MSDAAPPDRAAIRRHVREALVLKIGEPATPAAATAPAQGRGRPLIVAEDVTRARSAGRALDVPENALVTPLARETAARLGVDLRVAVAKEASSAAPPESAPAPAPAARADAAPAATSSSSRVVAVAADHGGYPLKQKLKAYLEGELGLRVMDLGAHSEAAVDYPDVAHAAAAVVARGEASCAIVVDGAGLGSAMAANRRRGVRAATCLTILQALNAREHNDANVLCLGGRHLGEDAAKAVATTFLRTAFAGGRHQRRVDKIDAGAP